MLIARAFNGFPTWIKLYINSCEFLENGPLCGPLTFERSPNMVRRSACMSASFFAFVYAHGELSFIGGAHWKSIDKT